NRVGSVKTPATFLKTEYHLLLFQAHRNWVGAKIHCPWQLRKYGVRAL
ncbi:MAG: hypothetical protein ACJAYC_003762, partial [Halieaceae bacterium]